MSRRRTPGKQTELDARYQELRLLRVGQAARILGVESDMFRIYAKTHGNPLAAVSFEWKGLTMWGYPLDTVTAVRAQMDAMQPRTT